MSLFAKFFADSQLQLQQKNGSDKATKDKDQAVGKEVIAKPFRWRPSSFLNQQQKAPMDKATKDNNQAEGKRVFFKPRKLVFPSPSAIQQRKVPPMANSGNIYAKTFKWEIDKVMALEQANGEYVQSEIFTSKGPYGQPNVKWALRLFPRGATGISENNVSVFLHLLDGNGSNYVKADWKLAIINEKGTKVNEQEQKSCLFDLESDTPEIGWGFHNFIYRSKLDKNTCQRHKLILQSEITIKSEKDLQSELKQEKIQTKNLKRKLNSKEEEVEKLRSDYEQYKKRSRNEIEKEHLAAIEKVKKKEDERRSQLHSAYELQLKCYRERIANLEKDKAAIEKDRKDEKERSNQLRSGYLEYVKRHRESISKVEKEKLAAEEKLEKFKGKYEKLYNHYQQHILVSSTLMEEIENDDDENDEPADSTGQQEEIENNDENDDEQEADQNRSD